MESHKLPELSHLPDLGLMDDTEPEIWEDRSPTGLHLPLLSNQNLITHTNYAHLFINKDM